MEGAKTFCTHWDNIRARLGLHWENGKDNGNYYVGFRVQGLIQEILTDFKTRWPNTGLITSEESTSVPASVECCNEVGGTF